MKTTKTFDKLVSAWYEEPDYINSVGGMRSGKTYSMLQLLTLVVNNETTEHTVNSIVSETLPHLKKGAIRDYKAIMGDLGLWTDKRWNATETFYEFPNGSIMEFFSADSPAKVHGPSRDRIFINEAQNIQEETARQLLARTKGLKAWDYNPTHSFWANEVYEGLDRCKTVRSTYLDNPFLTESQIYEIELHKKDENWWRVYGQGLLGMLEGLIYEFTQIDRMPENNGQFIESYGLDFGYTNDPTALIRCLINTATREIFLDQVCFRRGMHNSDIADLLKAQGIKPTQEIYADCAEPKSIDEIASYGFNLKKSYKNNTIKAQVDFIKTYTIYVTKSSIEMIKEFRNYQWKKTKDGIYLNEPSDFMNHAMDAFRYGVYGPFGEFGNNIITVHVH